MDSRYYKGMYFTSPSKSHGAMDDLISWHQDVNPSNIYVKSTSKGSTYDCQMKLGDVEISHFKKVDPQEEALDIDSYGTRALGLLPCAPADFGVGSNCSISAPECYRSDVVTEDTVLSLGKVLISGGSGAFLVKVAAWLVHGWDSVLKYRERRWTETKGKRDFSDGNALHDGSEVSPNPCNADGRTSY